MKIISHTEFQRNNKKLRDLISKDDVMVIKNNKPSFVAVKAENYEKYIRKINEYNLGYIITQIKSIKKELQTSGITGVKIFGSFARGEENDKSDLDIIYETKNKGLEAFINTSTFSTILPSLVINAVPSSALKESFKESIAEEVINVF